jgi:predicted nucleic acid-binding protein
MAGRAGVTARVEALSRDEVAICQVTAAEIEFGLRRLPRSHRRASLERRWEVIGAELVRVSWDDQVSRIFGEQKARSYGGGKRLSDFDLAIACHALAHAMTLVTADAAFSRLRLDLENWLA